MRTRPASAFAFSAGAVRAWTLFYRVNGLQKRYTLGRYPAVSLADARVLAREAQLAVQKAAIPPPRRKRHASDLRRSCSFAPPSGPFGALAAAPLAAVPIGFVAGGPRL